MERWEPTLLFFLLCIIRYSSSGGCEKPVADIVFLLDESGSVGKENFQTVKEFTIDIIRSLKIGKNQVRVATISFSYKAYINFHLKKYYDQNSLIHAIRNLPYRSYSTNTHLALRLVNTVFTEEHGDRPDAPNIAIVITDGRANHHYETIIEASKLKNASVVMFSIGIGGYLDQDLTSRQELEAMASKPTSEHKFIVSNFSTLNKITKKITTMICGVSGQNTTTPIPETSTVKSPTSTLMISAGNSSSGQNTTTPIPETSTVESPTSTLMICEETVADIVFLFDESASVKEENFQAIKEFTIDIIRSLNIGQNQVRVATISFTDEAYINFNLTEYYDQNSLIHAIMNLTCCEGMTNTHLALQLLNTVFKEEQGDRPDAPNIAIVITDGESLDYNKTIIEASKLQDASVVMFSIGIGEDLNQDELEAMASEPTSEHQFTVDNFSSLNEITMNITTMICEVSASNSSSDQNTTTPKPETSTVKSPTCPQMRATCCLGWINVESVCYRIINKKTTSLEASNNCNGDSILATGIPEDLREIIGYNETVWLNKSGNLRACNLGDPSTCKTSGKYYSLCSKTMLNDEISSSGPASFFDGSFWIIPNTKKSLEIIKEQYPKCCSPEGKWIGLYKTNGKLFWLDNSPVSEKEKALLNISDAVSEGDCAMYNGSITFTSCSSRKKGLTLNVPCSYPRPRRELSPEEFQNILKELTIDKKKTSKYKRSKTSASDERTSSMVIGVIAAVMIGFPLTAIVISDVPILIIQISAAYRNIIKIFR